MGGIDPILLLGTLSDRPTARLSMRRVRRSRPEELTPRAMDEARQGRPTGGAVTECTLRRVFSRRPNLIILGLKVGKPIHTYEKHTECYARNHRPGGDQRGFRVA